MAQRGRKSGARTIDKPEERKVIYLMKKDDLRTGMTVQLRNGERYIVLTNTGLCGDEENVMYRYGKWLSLEWYDKDMKASGRCDPFSHLVIRPGCCYQNSDYDIMKVFCIRTINDIPKSMKDCDDVDLIYKREE